MLAFADKSGKVSLSAKKLAKISNISEENAVLAIQIFSTKDERSRDSEKEGKRIEILEDGFRILNYEKYNDPFKKVRAKPVVSGPATLDYSSVQAIKFYWLKQYNTELPDARIYRELNPLAEEDKTLLCRAFSSYIGQTPAMYFSWAKFRDTWKTWLPKPKGADPREIFNKILISNTGYSPAIGSFWTGADVKKKFGEEAFLAFEKIGGNEKLKSVTNENKPFAEREFVKAYEQA